jgi:hypothetical protein
VLVGSLAVAVASVPALIRTLKVREVLPALYRTATLTLVGCAVAIAPVGTASWGADGTLAAMVLVLGMPIAVGLYVWARGSDPPTSRLKNLLSPGVLSLSALVAQPMRELRA